MLGGCRTDILYGDRWWVTAGVWLTKGRPPDVTQAAYNWSYKDTQPVAVLSEM